MNQDCIFCKIIAGQVSSSRVYEDDQVFAFMDILPVREGQVLVIPKQHVDHFTDLDIGTATQVFQRAFKISQTIKSKLQPERVGFIVHGYGVPHAHMILLPQHDKDDITSGRLVKIDNGQIVFDPHNVPMADREGLDRVSKLLTE